MEQLAIFTQVEPSVSQTPEAAMMAALCRGDLAGVLAVLNPLGLIETRNVCLKAGFSLSFAKSKHGILRDIEPQILRACREHKTGYELRDPINLGV